MSTRPARTSISRRAQNLFQDNTLLESSESSPEATPLSYHTHKRTSHRPPSDKLEKITNYRTTDRLGTANEGSRVNRSFVEQKSAKKSRTLISEADQQRNHSRNRSFEGKLSAKKTIKPEAAVHAGSCQKEKFLLKNRAAELQETVVKQGKKLKKFYKQIVGKREEINKLTDQLIASKQKTGIILELQEKAKAAQENENNLMIYLREQQKVAKEALSKLHELQEESINEIERAKQYYKEYYQKQSDEDRVHYEDRLQRSELERERLISMIKDLEITLNTEKSYSSKSSILSEEVAILKSQLNEKVVEIERLRFENRGLKHTIEENKQLASMEIKDLKYELEMLNEHSRTMKTQEEEIYNKENASLRRNLEDLEQQLYDKDRLLHEKDATYRDQVGVINQKVLNLQSELRKLTEYEEKIERLNKEVMFKDEEVQMVKKYYKEKMDKTKAKQKEQKREWSGIYNELLGEIKQLKGDIDALGHENKRLITSIKTKSIRDGY